MTTLIELFDDIADAIRGKDGSEADIAALDFPTRISAIETGSSEPSSGDVYALLYEDGFMSIQYGNEQYDTYCHGNVSRTYRDFRFLPTDSVTNVSWPWYTGTQENPITYVRVRHAISFSNCAYMFYNCQKLRMADMALVDLSGCVSTTGMFGNANKLTYVFGCQHWDLGNVTTVEGMFSGCTNLRRAEAGDWGLGRFTTLKNMFQACSNLEYVDSSGWDTSKVTTLVAAFYGCNNLETLDVSGWDTSKVESLTNAFYSCSSLGTLDVSDWDVSSLATANNAFASCSGLDVLDVSAWRPNVLASAKQMFRGVGASSMDLSGWVAPLLTEVDSMFESCSAATIDLGTVFGGTLTTMASMFKACKATSLDLRALDVSAVTSLSSVFASASSLVTLDLSTWDTSRVTTMTSMMNACSKLVTVYVGDSWSTASVATSSYVLSSVTSIVGGCGTTYSGTGLKYAHADTEGNPGYFTYKSTLTGDPTGILYEDGTLVLQLGETTQTDLHGDVVQTFTGLRTDGYTTNVHTPWRDYASQVTSVVARCSLGVASLQCWFEYMTALTSVDVASLIDAQVTNLDYLFYNCTSLTSIDLTGADLTGVTTSEFMCSFCSNLATFAAPFGSALTECYRMFYYCKKLTSVNTDEWGCDQGMDVRDMFMECDAIAEVDLNGWSFGYVSGLFDGCDNLVTANMAGTTCTATSLSSICKGCSKLTAFDMSGWTVRPTNTLNVFNKCYAITELDLSGWDTTALTSADSLNFYRSYQLTKIVVGTGFDIHGNTESTLCIKVQPNGSGTYWYDQATGMAHEYDQLPAGVAATYVATSPILDGE